MLKERELESHGLLVPVDMFVQIFIHFPSAFQFHSVNLEHLFADLPLFSHRQSCAFLILMNLSRKHVIMIPASAIRIFILLPHTRVLSKIMGMRNLLGIFSNCEAHKTAHCSFCWCADGKLLW